MGSIYRNFTDLLHARFTTKQNITPRSFLNDKVQLVADIEAPKRIPFTFFYSSAQNASSNSVTVPLFTVRGTTTPTIAFLDDIDTITIENYACSLFSGADAAANVRSTVSQGGFNAGVSTYLSVRIKAIDITATAINQQTNVVDDILSTIPVDSPYYIANFAALNTAVVPNPRITPPSNINLVCAYNWAAADDNDRYFTIAIRGFYTERLAFG
jgi:hypothetical protein